MAREVKQKVNYGSPIKTKLAPKPDPKPIHELVKQSGLTLINGKVR